MRRFFLWLEDRFDAEPGYGPRVYLTFALRALCWSITMNGVTVREDWPMRCYHCRRWFDRDFFWNPWGPKTGPGLCCSEECCTAVTRKEHVWDSTMLGDNRERGCVVCAPKRCPIHEPATPSTDRGTR